MSWWNSINWATVAAFASGAGGIGSWVAATRSLKSSSKAAEAAAGLTAIEAERTHRELIPEFRFTLAEQHQGVDDHAELAVELVGPAGLDFLDEVTITILDEAGRDHWGRGLPAGHEREAERFVWGPYEFNTGASAQVDGNRVTKPRRYSRVDGNNWDRLSLYRTRPGTWMDGTTPEMWRKQQTGPIRLSVTCRKAGFPAWYLLYEVPTATA